MRFVMAGLTVFILFAGLSANATTMRDLLDGGSLQQGDLQFFDFGGFSSMAIAGAQPVTPNQITAATKEDAFGPGLVFDSFAFSVGENEAQTTSFTFLVRSLSDLEEITDAELSLKATGEATATVFERITDLSGNSLGLNRTFSSPNGAMLSDTSTFPPQSVIRVEKIITLNGNASSGEQIDEFRQDFSIPEPSSLSLAMVGIFHLGLISVVGRSKTL